MEADEVEELQVQLQECLIQIIFNLSNWRLNFAPLFFSILPFLGEHGSQFTGGEVSL